MRRVFAAFVAALLVFGGWMGLASAQEEAPAAPRFPAVDNGEAWKLLPRETPPLPDWARALVSSMPKTTAAMLELDYVHRVKNPLGPVLAGKLRWAAADEIGCDYARKYAEADLRRAGLKEDDLKLIAGDRLQMATKDRLALDFARKLTRAGHEITDEEVAELIQQFGPEAVVGIVHTIAHANFQNRIFLALGVKVEADGPLPALELRLDAAKRAEILVPARPSMEELAKAQPLARAIARPDWNKRTFDDVEQALEGQKNRGMRIPLPDAERIAAIPAEAKEQASKVVWSKVSMGYQPVLTKAWFDCMGTFREESKMDRVFSNSVFWVITRSNECFY